MGGEDGGAALAEHDSLDLAELVSSLLLADAVHHKAALGVVDQAEVLVGLVDVDDVHEAGGVALLGADLAVNLHEPLHEDLLTLLAVEGIPAIASARGGREGRCGAALSTSERPQSSSRRTSTTENPRNPNPTHSDKPYTKHQTRCCTAAPLRKSGRSLLHCTKKLTNESPFTVKELNGRLCTTSNKCSRGNGNALFDWPVMDCGGEKDRERREGRKGGGEVKTTKGGQGAERLAVARAYLRRLRRTRSRGRHSRDLWGPGAGLVAC